MPTPSDDRTIRLTLNNLGLTEAYVLGYSPEDPVIPLFCRKTHGACLHSLENPEGGISNTDGSLKTTRNFSGCNSCVRTKEA